MTQEELKEWHSWYKQYRGGNHLSDSDWRELVRLNHLVMEMSHYIHNDNMLGNN